MYPRVPVRHRDHEHLYPRRGLPDVPARQGAAGYAEDDLDLLLDGARLHFPHFPTPVPRRSAKLAHVSAGLPVRTRVRHGDRDRASRHVGSEALAGLSLWSILVFPALFTAGMSLVDTTDGVLMLKAYGWAFVKPVRKLYYNMTMTFVSVLVALIIGGLETLDLIGDKLELKGSFWETIGAINDNFGTFGYVIIGVFVATWTLSVLFYRWMDYDRLEPVPVRSEERIES